MKYFTKNKKLLKIFLLGFISSLFFLNGGYDVNAQDAKKLEISAEKTTIKRDEYVKIELKTTDSSLSGKKAVFTSSPEVTGFNNERTYCYLYQDDDNYRCVVDFKSSVQEEIIYTIYGGIENVYTDSIKITVNGSNSGDETPFIIRNEPVTKYEFLAPLLGFTEFDTSQECAFLTYFNNMFKIIISIAGILAMIMIIYGGIEYMTSGVISEKESGKETITNAVLGLVILLGAVLILQTINPKLLDLCLRLPEQVIDLGGDSGNVQITKVSKEKIEALGIKCPEGGGQKKLKEIAESFLAYDKIRYSNIYRNTIGSDGTYYLDCSAFVYQLYTCAGLPPVGSTTEVAFNSSESKEIQKKEGNKVNDKDLQIGDVLGWKPKKEPNGEILTGNHGHMIMYLDNGKSIEVFKPENINSKAIKTNQWDKYRKLKYIIKLETGPSNSSN